MKLLIAFLAILLLLPIASGSVMRIDEKLMGKQNDSINVIVKFREAPATEKARQEDILKAAKKEGKLVLKRRLNNLVSLDVSRKALDKLSRSPDVEAIYYDPILHISEEPSVLMGAGSFWNISFNAMSVNGTGMTACVIDTGIDYTHPAFGACNISRNIFSGNNNSISLDSPHPYSINSRLLYKINYTGFSRIAVHFPEISTEPEWDFVKIIDADNNTVAAYTGSHTDVWTPSAEGDTIYVLLESDDNTNDYGFAIDAALNGTADTSLNWSLCDKVIGGWDFSGAVQAEDDDDPMDDHGHGTRVSGIIASNNMTYPGVSPGASIVAVKALNSGGSGSGSDAAAAIEFCTENKERYNISVIILSIGAGDYTDHCDSDFEWYYDIIQAAADKGIAVIASAGNDAGNTGISFPACLSNVISVSSADMNNTLSDFSRTAPILDLLSYGRDIMTTELGGGFTDVFGTSMAAPHVAGAILLIKSFKMQENGTILIPAELKNILKASGMNASDLVKNLTFPIVNLTSALSYVDSLPGMPYFLHDTNNSDLSRDYSYVEFSASETLKEAIIGIDSENYTINVSDLRYNMTGLSEGYHNFTIRIYDTTGNMFSSGMFHFFVDTVMPQSVKDLEASASQDGSVFINWSKVIYDIDNTTEKSIMYYIYRSEGQVNLSDDSQRVAIISDDNMSYIDTDITTGANYTYAIITIDASGNTNDSLCSGSYASIIPMNCNSTFSGWAAWSTCIGGHQSRTRSRICYGNSSQETMQTETRECTLRSGGGGGSGGIAIVPTRPEQQEGSVEGKFYSFNLSGRFPASNANFTFSENVSGFDVALGRAKTVQGPDWPTYSQFEMSMSRDPSLVKSGEMAFSVSRSWLSENNISAEQVSLFIFTEGWKELPTSIISRDETEITYISIIPGPGDFAIGSHPPSGAEDQRQITTQEVDTLPAHVPETSVITPPLPQEKAEDITAYILAAMLAGASLAIFGYLRLKE